MLEVGTGFPSELMTGRENVFLNGADPRHEPREIRASFDEIVPSPRSSGSSTRP